MKLAMLGSDASTLEIARAAVRDPRHDVVLLAECDPRTGDALAGQMREAAPAARLAPAWEDLLDIQRVDVVVVAAGDEDRRADQLRKFLQAGIPVLAAHPLFLSMLVYYELEMIRDDVGSVLLPFLPERNHPAVSEVRAVLAGGEQGPVGSPVGTSVPVGTVERVTMERYLADRSKDAVLWQLARDVDLLRATCGDITHVGATGVSPESAAYTALCVQMMAGGRPVQWTVAGAEADCDARLTVFGSRGRLALELRGRQPWRLRGSASDAAAVREFPEWLPAATALAALEGAIAGRQASPNWLDASRSIELAETAQRSLRKGRTLEVHYEEFTEEGTFKGTMASVGCGLLLASLVLVVCLALALDFARVLGIQIPYADKWPYLMLGVLGVFLLLQLLRLLFEKDSES